MFAAVRILRDDWHDPFGISRSTLMAEHYFESGSKKISDKAAVVGQQISEFKENAGQAIEGVRGPTADRLDDVSSGIHANADKLPPNVSQFAHQAADGLGATADYVRG